MTCKLTNFPSTALIKGTTLGTLIEAALRLLVRRPKLQANAFIQGHCVYKTVAIFYMQVDKFETFIVTLNTYRYK